MPTRQPAVFNSQNAPLFIRHVRARNGDADAIIRRFGLPASVEQRAEVQLPMRALHDLAEACAAAVDDPFFGLSAAESAPRGVFGLFEFACRNASTLGAALARLVQYSPLLNPIDRVYVDNQHDQWVVKFVVPGEPECWGRHFNECCLALLCRTAREASGGRFAPTRVWFAHPEPTGADRIRQALATHDLAFDAGQNGLAIARDLLKTPLLSGDEALLRILDEQARQQLQDQPTPGTFVSKLRELVRRELRAGPRMERIAAGLSMSTRTLQRKLAEDGTSFQRLVDEVRQDSARALLTHTSRPIKVIAAALGYSDTRAFIRAYKRATGRTPGRDRLAAHAPGDFSPLAH